MHFMHSCLLIHLTKLPANFEHKILIYEMLQTVKSNTVTLICILKIIVNILLLKHQVYQQILNIGSHSNLI